MSASLLPLAGLGFLVVVLGGAIIGGRARMAAGILLAAAVWAGLMLGYTAWAGGG